MTLPTAADGAAREGGRRNDGASVLAASETTYLTDPHPGDVYAINLNQLVPGTDTQYPYSLLKVRDVSGDDITVSPASHVYTASSGAEKAMTSNGADDFLDRVKVLHHADLTRLHADGTITQVLRH